MAQALNQVEWVCSTHQARSQETVERILEAAEEIISEKGFENATVSEIVSRAKSSVGSMYARFADKDSLLVTLHQRFCEQAIATTDTALDPVRWQGASIADIMSTAIPFVVQVYQMKRGLLRAFIVRGSTDQAFVERGGELGRAISERLIALLMARRDQIRHPDPALAVDFGLRLIFDTMDQTTLYGDVQRSSIKYAPRQFAEELTRAFLSYLGVDAGPAWESAD